MTDPSTYYHRFSLFEEVAGRLESHLRSVVDGLPHIDRVGARAKSPDRFIAKAAKKENDALKYDNPFVQIQDQIGGRITVFYLRDVEICKERVTKFMTFIESQDKSPSTESEFGYFGAHFIMNLPDDVIPDGADRDLIPDFFELQIKTLFQHAWSEAHHDLGYKSVRDLTSLEKRKVAFTAAQAWGADTIFEDLAMALSTNDNDRS